MSMGPTSAGRGSHQAGAIARYRLRGVLRRGRAGYLAIVLITGLLEISVVDILLALRHLRAYGDIARRRRDPRAARREREATACAS